MSGEDRWEAILNRPAGRRASNANPQYLGLHTYFESTTSTGTGTACHQAHCQEAYYRQFAGCPLGAGASSAAREQEVKELVLNGLEEAEAVASLELAGGNLHSAMQLVMEAAQVMAQVSRHQ